ncbi:MAG: leucine-rich repeat protein, partial [Clostridia bacterium]|nr:leucine-rich repeat protein [Clostridia bacterium]
LFMQNNSYITFDDVTEALYISTYDLGDLGKDWYLGFGALDIDALILGSRGEITYDMLTDELDNIEGKFIRGHALQELPEPERLYAVFDGWYYDDTFTQEYSYYEDIFYGDITLYAKWVNEDDGVPYTYVELEDGTIEIRSYTGKRKYITVPETINGKAVSSIGDFAFQNNNKLREVVLPDSVNHIGISAFAGCTNLVTMYIPANVTEIEVGAFQGDVRLSTVAFKGSSKLTTIGDLAFAYCSSLRTFEVPSGVKYLNGSAFFGTASLKSIKVQKGNIDFTSIDGVLFNYSKNTLVAFPAAKGNTYALPNGTTVIGDYAFGYCKLEEIDLNKVERVGAYSFAFSALRILNIPDTVNHAGKAAFYSCPYLSDVTIGRGLAILSQEMFMYSTRLENIVIPNTVFAIDMKAFAKSALTEVTFEENSVLTEIGGCVFLECQIEEIDIPDSVAAIGNTAFAYNPLTEVNFGENSQLWGIGNEAFSYCPFLESIILPDRLEYIGDRAFLLSGLKSITVPASV